MPHLGELERSVMNVLWDAAAPLTVREVLDGLGDRDLAYTTVMTVLDRLGSKEMVRRERDGRGHLLLDHRAQLATADGEVGVAEVVGLRREDLGDAVGPAAQTIGVRRVGIADPLGEGVAEGDVAVEGHRDILPWVS